MHSKAIINAVGEFPYGCYIRDLACESKGTDGPSMLLRLSSLIY